MPDVSEGLAAFCDALRAGNLFETGAPITVARAPGRLDVMGGIADYSGSLVLQRPVAEAAFAAVQRIDSPRLEVVSLGREPCTITLDTLAPGGVVIGDDDARRMFGAGQMGVPGIRRLPHWASYVAGPIIVLARERGWSLTSGARIVVSSEVPEGKGVSSSAAVETASMRAAADAFGIAIEPRELALLCQRSENFITGAPCGVMDQMTCVFGECDRLMALLCQPARLEPSVSVPEDIGLWGLDSGERHAVGGSDYGAVRTGAFMGLRLLNADCDVEERYLANISPLDFERELAGCLPEEMSGAAFLHHYDGTVDTATRVDADRRYRVLAPTAHPIYERQRAELFRQLLGSATDESDRVRLGALMYESHASYVRCGLGSPGTDALVDLVRAEGAASGLYGARITGGGSGGTVAVLGRRDAATAIARVADAYQRRSGHRPHIFAGSSPGVAAFGTRSITV